MGKLENTIEVDIASFGVHVNISYIRHQVERLLSIPIIDVLFFVFKGL